MPFADINRRREWDLDRQDVAGARGLCLSCSRPSPVTRLCLRCRKRRAKRRAAVNAARVARGVCVTCPRTPKPGKRYCEDCRAATKIANDNRRAAQKQAARKDAA